MKRGAEITRGGAQFGTAAVGGSRELTLGGARCVRERPEAPPRLSSSSSSLQQKTFNRLAQSAPHELNDICLV